MSLWVPPEASGEPSLLPDSLLLVQTGAEGGLSLLRAWGVGGGSGGRC